MEDRFFKIINGFGVYALLILVIIYILYYPEKAQKIAGWIQFFVSFVFSNFKKKSVKNRLEADCSRSLRRFGKEVLGLSIPKLSIKWINGDNCDTEFKEGEAIVKLNFSRDQARNIINATSIYVKDVFLKRSKLYMSDGLKQAIDLSVTKSILLKIDKNMDNIISQFIEEKDDEFYKYGDKCNKIEQIDDAGLFTRILIREYDCFGNKLVGRNPNGTYNKESDDFLDYIYNIATREPKEETELQFVHSTLKIGVLLVAKIETVTKGGLTPYLRRVSLGYARGIKTFYLLARDDKVGILENIAKELLGTGSFNLVNKPHIFKDSQGRESICYCVKIDKESSIAQSYLKIEEAKEHEEVIQGVITRVRNDKIFVDVNGVEGYICSNNFSDKFINNPHDYFKENTILNIKPIATNSEGNVEFTLRGTDSDPYNIIENDYSIGKDVEAIVDYVDDEFVKFKLDNVQITAIAFRQDLTYSKYTLLIDKFKIGDKNIFTIKEITFNKNQLVLRLKDLVDPWDELKLIKNTIANFVPCKREQFFLIGEIQEGITTILPYNELSWFDNEIELKKRECLLGNKIKCYIKEVCKEKRIVYVTLNDINKNPYVDYYNLSKDRDVNCILFGKNNYGLLGKIENKFDLFVPNSESCRGENHYEYKLHKKIKVRVKDIADRKKSIIGSFKPFIPYPLQNFADRYKVGQVMINLKKINVFNEGISYGINDGRKSYEAFLFKREISSLCYIDSCMNIFNNVESVPLKIKNIDLEKNKILLSLKDLLDSNKDRISNLNYEQTFDSIIIGKRYNGYIVLLANIWIEGLLETEKKYNIGDKIKTRGSRLSTYPIVLIEND